LAGVPLLGTWGSIQWVVKWALALEREAVAAGATPTLYVKEMTQACGAAGAILGTVLAAFLCELVGRRPAYAWLCLASLVSVAWLYLGNARWGPGFLVAMLLANGATSSFYGWFPLAFPEWFPTAVRSSAQGFAFNFGRVIAAVGSLQTAALVVFFSAGLPADRIEAEGFPRAAICLSLVYLVGAAIIWLAPETRGQPLPDAVFSGITRLKDQRTGARRNGGRSAPD
jgi:MFS transporter, SHS family, sialic acid transporter